MKAIFHGGNRLLFRSFMFLVGGLLLVALVLDFGFRQIQSQNEPDVDRWLEATARLVEAELGKTPTAQRDAKTVELATAIGTGVQLLARDDVRLRRVEVGEPRAHVAQDRGNTERSRRVAVHGRAAVGHGWRPRP